MPARSQPYALIYPTILLISILGTLFASPASKASAVLTNAIEQQVQQLKPWMIQVGSSSYSTPRQMTSSVTPQAKTLTSNRPTIHIHDLFAQTTIVQPSHPPYTSKPSTQTLLAQHTQSFTNKRFSPQLATQFNPSRSVRFEQMMTSAPSEFRSQSNGQLLNNHPYQAIESQMSLSNNTVDNMYGSAETPTLSTLSKKRIRSKNPAFAYKRVITPPNEPAYRAINSAAPIASSYVSNTATPTIYPNDGNRLWTIYPNDGSILAALTRWAKEAGWQISWESPMDFPVSVSAGFQGTFPDAIEGVMRSLSQSDFPLQACLYEGNRVVRIMRLVTNPRGCE